MELSAENCTLFCRTCLTQLSENKFNIFVQNRIEKLLVICTSLHFEENEKFPDSICQLCFEKLNEFYNFREMCLNTVNKLNDIVNNGEYINNGTFNGNYACDEKLIDVITNSEYIDVDKEYQPEHSLEQEFDKNTFEHDSNESIHDSDSEDYDSEVIDKNCEVTGVKSRASNNPEFRKTASKTNPEEKKLNQIYVCDKCPKKCFKKERMDAHKRTHEGLRPFPCILCEKAYNKKSHLNAHIKDVHNKTVEIIACEVEGCGKTFKRNQTYRAHCRAKHSERPYEPKIFVCEDCGKTFKNISTLKEHRYKHSGEEYPYKCEQCPKKYISQRTYREHLLRHAGIKNFICPYCGMKKTTKSELRTHINYHTKEKQWHCPSCSQIFNSSANLGLHVRVVHKGIRRYSCKYCDQSFGKAETLKHHEMRHTGEKPHECKVCGKRFIQIVAMRAHLKTHNK